MSLLAARSRLDESSSPKEKKEKREKKEKKGAGDDVDEEVARLLRAGTWREVVDDKSGKKYFFNPSTKATTWDLRKEVKKTRDAVGSSVGGVSGAGAPASPREDRPPATPSAPPVAEGTPAGGVQPAEPQSLPLRQREASAPPARPELTAFVEKGAAAASARGAAAGTAPADASDPANDPMARLLSENAQLQRLIASGSGGQVALEFQAKLDALQRTNAALTMQCERMKHEHDAMARALTDANRKIHELQVQQASGGGASERTKDEELQATVSHLREQNRILLTQLAELTTVLSRSLGEQAFRNAANMAAMGMGPIPTAAAGVPGGARAELQHTETNAGRAPQHFPVHGATALPTYAAVPDLTSPPPARHYTERPAAAAPPPPHDPQGTRAASPYAPTFGGTGGYGVDPALSRRAAAAPGVMYGGFVVRNPRAN